jgi:hypothetical protein
MENNILAWNDKTCLCWNGAGFTADMQHAKFINVVELAALRYTYQNVISRKHD